MEWPALPLDEWRETKDTLHRWTQVVGKIRMELTPPVNHWWHVPLYVSARGLTTSVIALGDRWFEMEFDFLAHQLRIRTNDGADRSVALAPRTVADFHDEVFSALKELGIRCTIWPVPQECEDTIPLDRDVEHKSYDAEYALRFWRVLAQSHAVLAQFRSSFLGKCSPIHFFWGSFDLALTRFSGRKAPERPGAGAMMREAYSHEVSSVGWWPGDSRLTEPSFYSYAAPEPAGFRTAAIKPAAVYYTEVLGGFYLPYDVMRLASDPEQTLLDFCQSAYDAAANLGHWDRTALERNEHV